MQQLWNKSSKLSLQLSKQIWTSVLQKIVPFILLHDSMVACLILSHLNETKKNYKEEILWETKLFFFKGKNKAKKACQTQYFQCKLSIFK